MPFVSPFRALLIISERFDLVRSAHTTNNLGNRLIIGWLVGWLFHVLAESL
jgi:hypothetical protein